MPDEHFPYPIEFNVLMDASKKIQEKFEEIFDDAAERWRKVIKDTQPAVPVDEKFIKGLWVEVMIGSYEFDKGVIAESTSLQRRPVSGIPALGVIKLERKLLGKERGLLLDILSHEIGHLLGFGKVRWNDLGLIAGLGTNNPTFNGASSMREYAKLLGSAQPVPVPLESHGGEATTECHWRNNEFGMELMTEFETGGNPLSRLTVASLEDIGYQVNYSAAEAYTLPTKHDLDLIALGTPRNS